MSKWIGCKDRMPIELPVRDTFKLSPVCICRYSGHWPNRGNGGVVDLYTYEGEWYNHPASVVITDWMYDPDYCEEEWYELYREN
jgi:hypothetical protein